MSYCLHNERVFSKPDVLQIPPLTDIAEEFFVNESDLINVENFADVQEIATKMNRTRLTEKIVCFLQKHFQSVRNSREFLNLPSDCLKRILQSSFLKVTKESEVVETVLKWVEADEERESELPKLMECVRLDHLEKKELWHIAKDDGVLKQSKECRGLINEALKRKFFEGDDKEKHFEQLKMESFRPRHSTCGLLMAAGGYKEGIGIFFRNYAIHWIPLPNSTIVVHQQFLSINHSVSAYLLLSFASFIC